MGLAIEIARRPRSEWADAIARVRPQCPHSDCTGGIGCQQRIREYLQLQWRMLARREAGKGGGR
ncbi:hypothetical protein [uncultured Azohydromonas sp.]|uniref:hypothetical protein n=1 Tax=uncultured Azohydromonas sp. TaxID=487342 RepID=UPI00261D812C|nr:hypothetical protein [uncultured Azohydromonas sp.]